MQLSLQVYPYEALIVTTRGRNRLPKDVDRARLEVSHFKIHLCNIHSFSVNSGYRAYPVNTGLMSYEFNILQGHNMSPIKLHNILTHTCNDFQRHLSPEEFYQVFGMTMAEFDRLALWKRNEMKKQARLF